MTDRDAALKSHATAASAKRLRQRKRAELRLQIYGLGAILLAGLALVALLWSVVGKASLAMTESYVSLPVTLKAADIDPDGSRNPKKIIRADFAGLTKRTLRHAFPEVKTRRAKRQLYDIVSGGAGFELGQLVAKNPDLIGQTIDFRFLASDTVDLYLKGQYGILSPQPSRGKLSVTMDGKVALVTSTADDFAPLLAKVKTGLLVRADTLRAQAARQDNGFRVFTDRANASRNATNKANNLGMASARAAARDKLLAEASDLARRATGATGGEALNGEQASVLVRVAGGWIKFSEISKQAGRGVILKPLDAPVNATRDWRLLSVDMPEAARKVSDQQMVWVETLREAGRIDTVFNTRFFTASDSREPELAGIKGALVGSLWTMLVTFVLAFPVGVSAAIYLEEFAPRNRITDLIEVNINNLAAVPSIIFGLLGLAVVIGFFGVPRSAPLAGGIVMALMTLPTIIIASRASIAAVPPSIRDAALGIGASKMQATFHHVLPLSLPGMLTGAILGMARALGETAPLIMIGMVAFIVDVPGGITDSATVLPVQVFRWADFPERAFEARTAAAICVLLVFLVSMNTVAVILRKKFERRW